MVALNCLIVSGKAVITGAEDLYAFLEENLTLPPESETEEPDQGVKPRCTHSVRKFFYVGVVNRSGEKEATKTYAGTQKLHSVRSCGREGTLEVRKRSCTCGWCTGCGKAESSCKNKEWVEDWQTISIMKKTRGQTVPKTNQEKVESSTTEKHQTNLVITRSKTRRRTMG